MGMILSGREAIRTIDSSRVVEGWSKMWTSNMTAHVIYPVVKGEDGQLEIALAACWGYDVDYEQMKTLKRVFIPCNSEVKDNKPLYPDFCWHFSKIAKMFMDAKKEKEINEVEDNENATKSEKRDAIAEIEKNYKESKKPVIGRLKYSVMTECLFVPLDAEGRPVKDKIQMCSQSLSSRKLKQLYTILDSGQFIIGEDEKGRMWLEVRYKFGGSNNRSKDAQDASVIGVTEKLSFQHVNGIVIEPAVPGIDMQKTMKVIEKEGAEPQFVLEGDSRLEMTDEALAASFGEGFTVRDPERGEGRYWKEIKEKIDSDLPDDPKVIHMRNASFRQIDEDVVKAAIKNYATFNYKPLDLLSNNADQVAKVKNNAEMFELLNVKFESDKLREAKELGLAKAQEDKALAEQSGVDTRKKISDEELNEAMNNIEESEEQAYNTGDKLDGNIAGSIANLASTLNSTSAEA